ncbi:hypothetical protein ACF8C6_13705 [Pseudomonas sp. zbq_18]|uniref:hypothetical protein n=1 Tax=Pseudomonas sp. zbq_18 TaxID=3367251 RepID=UPI00370A0E79
MDYEILISILAALSGITSLIIGFKKTKSESEANEYKVLLSELEKNEEQLKEALSEEEFEKIIATINKIDTKNLNEVAHNKQSGSATKNFLVYIVPGILALGLAGLYIYLRFSHAGNPDYVLPEDLSTLMTIIVGYLFGASAASV